MWRGEDLDYREMDRSQTTWGQGLMCQGKRTWVLLSGHGRPVGVECCCSLMLFQVNPLGMSCLTGPTRTDSRTTLYAGWSLFLESTWSSLLPCSLSLLQLHKSSGVLSSGEACPDASSLLCRGSILAPSSAPDTRGSTSLVYLIWSTAIPGVRCYQTLGGTEALWGSDTGRRSQG